MVKAKRRTQKCTTRAYLGIDPGQSGGLAIITPTRFGANIAKAVSMPQTERDIWNWFAAVANAFSSGNAKALIEKVHAMPKQGISGTFKFGAGYGGLRMALIGTDIPFEDETPQTWQRGLGIRKKKKTETDTQWKNHLRSKAQQLFPGLEITLKTADALLIAEYCRRKEEGLL